MIVTFEKEYLQNLYEKLHGDKEGLSSVRVNNQYRIEFEETKQNGEDISTICNITELSSHYK